MRILSLICVPAHLLAGRPGYSASDEGPRFGPEYISQIELKASVGATKHFDLCEMHKSVSNDYFGCCGYCCHCPKLWIVRFCIRVELCTCASFVRQGVAVGFQAVAMGLTQSPLTLMRVFLLTSVDFGSAPVRSSAWPALSVPRSNSVFSKGS